MVHCLQRQGHSEGLYNQNMTIFYSIFATNLGLVVQQNKLECHVEKLDYCIQGQGHNKGSECW